MVTELLGKRKTNPKKRKKTAQTKAEEIEVKTWKEMNGSGVKLINKHFVKDLTEENSIALSLNRDYNKDNGELTTNTVFQIPQHLLWLQKDALLVSPFPLNCHVVDLTQDPPKVVIKGKRWAIFCDRTYHFEHKCLEISVLESQPQPRRRPIG